MKKHIFAIGLSFVTLVLGYRSEARDITDKFLKTYVGKFVEDRFHESVVTDANGNIEIQRVRQVGSSKNNDVPFPTVCSYIEVGRIITVVERSPSDRERYLEYASHIINYALYRFEVNDYLSWSTSNPKCKNFERQENDEIAKGWVTQNLYSELLDENTFRLHTSGGGDYVKGGPRTPSTLDEVFIRTK